MTQAFSPFHLRRSILAVVASLFCGLVCHQGYAQEAGAKVSDVAALVANLDSDDPQVRWRAAKSLGELGPAAVSSVDQLIALLSDPNTSVRYNAALALGQLGDGSQKVLTALAKEIGDESMTNRLAAVTALRRLTDDPAKLVPLAARLLAGEDQLLASRALETLIVRGEKALPFLIEALKNEHAAYWACLAIDELGPVAADAVPGLQNILRTTDDVGLKVQAVIALAKIGSASDVAKQDLINLLQSDGSDGLRVAVAYAVGTLGYQDASSGLRANVASGDTLVSMVSLWALAKVNPDDPTAQVAALDAIVAGLSESDPTIRLTAAEGLQSLKPDPKLVAPRLLKLLGEKDPVVAHNLVEAFVSLGESAVPRAAAALQSEALRGLAVQVLERLGPKASAAVPQLVAALQDATGEFRQGLQMAIGQVGPAAAAATPELVRSLASELAPIRFTAIIALGNIGSASQSAVTSLKAHVKSANGSMEAVAAAWALTNIAADDADAVSVAVPTLIGGLQSDDELIQSEAVQALGRVSKTSEAATAALKKFAADPTVSEGLRAAAKAAL